MPIAFTQAKYFELKNILLHAVESVLGLRSPYILCNEADQSKIIANLGGEKKSQQRALTERVHFGFSVWFNYDIIATRRSSLAIICDIDPKVCVIYQHFNNAILKADSPKHFVELFLTNVCDDTRKISPFPKDYLKGLLQSELQRDDGWLGSKEKFAQVKKLHDEKKVLYLQLDVMDENTFLLIAKWLETNNLTIDTLYLSNIYEWLEKSQVPEGQQKYKDNVKRLLGKKTLCIDAYYPFSNSCKKSGPPLRISQGVLPNFNKAFKSKSRLGVSRRCSIFSDGGETTKDPAVSESKKVRRKCSRTLSLL